MKRKEKKANQSEHEDQEKPEIRNKDKRDPMICAFCDKRYTRQDQFLEHLRVCVFVNEL